MDIQEIKLKHQLVNIPIKDNENNVDKDINQLPHKSCSREKTNKISENLGSKYGEIKCSLAYSKDPNSKLLTLNSGKSLFETESDVNTKAGSSYSSAYFRKAVDKSSKSKNINVSNLFFFLIIFVVKINFKEINETNSKRKLTDAELSKT